VELPVRDVRGQTVDRIRLDDGVFGLPFNESVVHQAMVRQLANARLGTADTKTRGEVSGSKRKVYRQKHTGRARRGGIRSPLLRGGGVTFGPHPRDYRQRMPKKMRRLALRCVLSAKASSGELVVVDRFQLEQLKTAEMAHILKALDVGASALVVTLKTESNVVKAARNLPRTKTLQAALLNVLDVLSHRSLVITVDGIRCVEDILMRQRCASRVG
jgi:large subunit ribosomal protein L4